MPLPLPLLTPLLSSSIPWARLPPPMPSLLFSIPQDCCPATVVPIAGAVPLVALYIPLSLPTPPSSSSITQDPCRSAAASVVVSNSSGALSLPRPLPTPPVFSSIPRNCFRIVAASSIVAAPSGVPSFHLPPPTPSPSSSIPRSCIPLPTPPLSLSITQYLRHADTSNASIVVVNSLKISSFRCRLRRRRQYLGVLSIPLPLPTSTIEGYTPLGGPYQPKLNFW